MSTTSSTEHSVEITEDNLVCIGVDGTVTLLLDRRASATYLGISKGLCSQGTLLSIRLLKMFRDRKQVTDLEVTGGKR